MAFYNLLKRLRLTVNPELTESTFFGHQAIRFPAPAYEGDKQPNDRIAKNQYFMRDNRRNYPQTTVYMNPTAPQLAAGESVKSLPLGQGLAVVAPSLPALPDPARSDLPEGVSQTAVIPPSVYNYKPLTLSTSSGLPTNSKTQYFEVANYN
ncbi:hypothetical protein RI367_001292 [Sorochytrium milnesiophthora]